MFLFRRDHVKSLIRGTKNFKCFWRKRFWKSRYRKIS